MRFAPLLNSVVAVAMLGLTAGVASVAQAETGTGWGMPREAKPVFKTDATVPELPCRLYNLASRGDNGILREPFSSLMSQCYGTGPHYTILVQKYGHDLAAVFDGPVNEGGLPPVTNDEEKDTAWWDTNPSGDVKVPVDSGKERLPELQVSASSVNFGQVQIGDSKQRELSLSNAGQVTLHGVGISGLSAPFSSQAQCPSDLGAFASCSAQVVFAPGVPGAFSGQIQVASADGGSYLVALLGQGVAPSATLTSVLDFGSLPAGQTDTRVVTLTNTGIAPISVGGASVEGTGFSIVGTSCSTELSAAGSCSYSLALAAAGITTHTGLLTVQTEAGVQTADLSGQSLQASMSFNNTVSGSESTPRFAVGAQAAVNFTLTNVGNTAITGLTSGLAATVGVYGTNGLELWPGTTCSDSLSAGGSCIFRIGFMVTQAGNFYKEIVISSGNAGSQVLKIYALGV